MRLFDSTWRDQGRPQEEVTFGLSFEDGVGFSWEERVATGIPGRGVTCPLARSWERAEYMGVTAAVGLGGGGVCGGERWTQGWEGAGGGP